MSDDTQHAGGWPDPQRPGVPARPKRPIYHWLMRDAFAAEAIPTRWQPSSQTWRTGPAQDDNMTPEQIVAEGYEYYGECPVPSDVAALVAARVEAAIQAERVAQAEALIVTEAARIEVDAPTLAKAIAAARAEGIEWVIAMIEMTGSLRRDAGLPDSYDALITTIRALLRPGKEPGHG